MPQIIGEQEDNIIEDTLENDILDETVTPTASLTATSPLKLNDIALDTNSGGFVINGKAAGDYSGWSVSGAGDVNGDGLTDLIVGSARSLFLGDVGKSYLVFGKTNGSAVNLSDVATGIGGFAIDGEAANDQSGFSVSGAGDVNGDGLADLIVGAWGSNANGEYSGKSYVVFGKTDGSEVNLSDVSSGIGGFTLNAEAEEDAVGFSVSDALDVNGDGFDDLIVDAPGAGQFGKSYVVFGKANINSVQLSEVAAGIGGFAINGETEGDNAASVSSAGDFNGDGLADLILGAPNANPNGNESGKSYVVFGKTDSTEVNLSEVAAGVGGFALDGEAAYDNAGFSVSAAGDVNGDGLTDLIVGADGADPNGRNSGKSYVVFGKTDAASVNLSDVAAGNGGFALNGEAESNISGGSVSSAGDINADGLDDLIIGTNPITAMGVLAAIGYPELIPTFKSYVVFGKTDSTAVELSDVAAGIGGFALEKDYISSDVVSDAGDVNGDGFDDVMIGNPFADPTSKIDLNSRKGKSYVVYGGDFTGTVTQQGGTGDDLLTGTAATDVMVAGEGNDILIGNGDKDVLYAGVGDDLIGVSDLNFNRIKGGKGTDTLRLDSNGMFLDLKAIANNRITGIEQIDLNNSGSNALAFNKLDVVAMSDTKELVILGNTSDLVVSINQGWTPSGTQALDDNLYNTYAVGGVSLLVDSDISQLIS